MKARTTYISSTNVFFLFFFFPTCQRATSVKCPAAPRHADTAQQLQFSNSQIIPDIDSMILWSCGYSGSSVHDPWREQVVHCLPDLHPAGGALTKPNQAAPVQAVTLCIPTCIQHHTWPLWCIPHHNIPTPTSYWKRAVMMTSSSSWCLCEAYFCLLSQPSMIEGVLTTLSSLIHSRPTD